MYVFLAYIHARRWDKNDPFSCVCECTFALPADAATARLHSANYILAEAGAHIMQISNHFLPFSFAVFLLVLLIIVWLYDIAVQV